MKTLFAVAALALGALVHMAVADGLYLEVALALTLTIGGLALARWAP